ncbi:MAG: DNA primase, partial [Cyclobacteriaceae bacterium]|nr:DNA primase [Cyclobacteriaceae bacterium]
EEVKQRADIVEVISDFVQLKKAGANYKALSPFVDEKTPSFFVSPSKEIYKCFSSGKGGDAISFVMEYDGLSYLEAIKYLAEKYGIEIQEQEQTPEQILVQNERESIFIALNFAKEYYNDVLIKNTVGQSIGLSYFKERGYDLKIIEKFGLGYSLEEWDGFMKEALKKGYSENILDKAGLIVKKEEGKVYDRFRGRVIFPIHNLTGKAIAFGARTLRKDKKTPKYVNSPESEVYHKSDVLYGMHLAKRFIRDQDNCFLVEGYTDVISMHLSGIENVVASSGTSLTDNQIKLINRYTKNITVLFDGDSAGLKASLRGIDMILETDMNVRVVVFPEGEDPDSYSKKLGSAEFAEFLQQNAVDFIRFKAELLTKEASDDPIKKAETIKDIIQSISIIPDPVKRSVYLKETSDLLGIEESVLLAEQNKILIRKRKEKSKKAERETEDQLLQLDDTGVKKVDVTGISKDEIIALQEKETIRLLYTYGNDEFEEEGHIYDFILSELEEIDFKTPIYKEMLQLFKTQLEEGNVINAEYLIRNAPQHIKNEAVDMISEKYLLSKDWEDKFEIIVPDEKVNLDKVVEGNILRLKFRLVQQMIDEKREEIIHSNKNASYDEIQEQEVLKQLNLLKNAEVQIATQLGNVISK